MTTYGKNSLDLLRLFAATLVLYSHQHALLGMPEPSFFGLNSFGGAGVSIFFFLSGFLVWSSWARDPHSSRFFVRRSLRIFPGLWLVVFLTVFVMGPLLTGLAIKEYFGSSQTWHYLSTAALLVRQGLPGVFIGNPYALAINGSLWTLPVEFLCYVSVAVMGILFSTRHSWLIYPGLGMATVAVYGGPLLLGERFEPHFEMIAFFWWGVWYSHVVSSLSRSRGQVVFLGAAAFLFLILGPRGVDRAAMLLFVAATVFLAGKSDFGARLTDRLGDLSYGMYIFAFPVQQIFAQFGQISGWSFGQSLTLSLLATASLAFLSWHLVEKRALHFKPRVGGLS